MVGKLAVRQLVGERRIKQGLVRERRRVERLEIHMLEQGHTTSFFRLFHTYLTGEARAGAV